MKINLSTFQKFIFDTESGNRLKRVQEVFAYENGVRTDTVVGLRLTFAVDSELFPEMDTISVKLPLDVRENFDLTPGLKYLVSFDHLMGNFWGRQAGPNYIAVKLSLSADDMTQFEEA